MPVVENPTRKRRTEDKHSTVGGPGKIETQQAARVALPGAQPGPTWAHSSFSSAPQAWSKGVWTELGLCKGHAEVFVRDQERENCILQQGKSIMGENFSEELEFSDDCVKDILLLIGRKS